MSQIEKLAAQIAANAPLAAVVHVNAQARRLMARTEDSHAAHAVELYANRLGLRVLTTVDTVSATGFVRPVATSLFTIIARER